MVISQVLKWLFLKGSQSCWGLEAQNWKAESGLSLCKLRYTGYSPKNVGCLSWGKEERTLKPRAVVLFYFSKLPQGQFYIALNEFKLDLRDMPSCEQTPVPSAWTSEGQGFDLVTRVCFIPLSDWLILVVHLDDFYKDHLKDQRDGRSFHFNRVLHGVVNFISTTNLHAKYYHRHFGT